MTDVAGYLVKTGVINMSETTYYEYKVQFVGNYWDFNARVQLALDEDTGNTSDWAKTEAINEALNIDWIEELCAMSHETNVTLLLDGEEVEL